MEKVQKNLGNSSVSERVEKLTALLNRAQMLLDEGYISRTVYRVNTKAILDRIDLIEQGLI